MTEKKTPVLVTTAHRGVFFGHLDSEVSKEKITLTNCRNVIYWSSDLRGFLGLATVGPNDTCKIGPAADRVTLFDITSITECSDEAAEKWEALK